MASGRRDSQAERAAAFGSRIRQIRRAASLTQRDVAERIPMSAANLSRIENGDQGPPPDEIIAALAAALETDENELFELAGRRSSDFEAAVLGEIRALRRELQDGLARLERAIDS